MADDKLIWLTDLGSRPCSVRESEIKSIKTLKSDCGNPERTSVQLTNTHIVVIETPDEIRTLIETERE